MSRGRKRSHRRQQQAVRPGCGGDTPWPERVFLLLRQIWSDLDRFPSRREQELRWQEALALVEEAARAWQELRAGELGGLEADRLWALVLECSSSPGRAWRGGSGAPGISPPATCTSRAGRSQGL